jgi:hypothetical protein
MNIQVYQIFTGHFTWFEGFRRVRWCFKTKLSGKTKGASLAFDDVAVEGLCSEI